MNIELTEVEVNIVLNALAQRPFGEVYQLIDKVRQQALAQVPPPVASPPA